ncbi:MAG: hypothetical protein QM731_13300 [Chitinophagaceae bacterium]
MNKQQPVEKVKDILIHYIISRLTNIIPGIVPSGNKALLDLADGIKIRLNAATTLLYPAKFNCTDRVIELVDEEAYFEVVKQLSPSVSVSVPFIVKVVPDG